MLNDFLKVVATLALLALVFIAFQMTQNGRYQVSHTTQGSILLDTSTGTIYKSGGPNGWEWKAVRFKPQN